MHLFFTTKVTKKYTKATKHIFWPLWLKFVSYFGNFCNTITFSADPNYSLIIDLTTEELFYLTLGSP